MNRHLPQLTRRISLERGDAYIDTSAFRDCTRPVWLGHAGIVTNMTPAEARALGQALIEAATHAEAARRPALRAAA